MFAVPAKDVPLDQYGNMSAGKIKQMMSALSLGRETGYQSNITVESARRNRNRAKCFTIGKPPIGVFTRQKGGEIKPFIMFVRSPHYTKRFDLFGVGKRVVDEHLANEMKNAIEEALRTAR